MKLVNQLGIRAKLLVAPAIAIALSAAGLGVALFMQAHQNRTMNSLLDEDVAAYALVSAAATSAATGHAAMLDAVAALRNNAKAEVVKKLSDGALHEIDQARSTLRQGAAGPGGAAMAPVADSLDRYRKAAAEALEMADSDVNLASMAVQSAGAEFVKVRSGVAGLLEDTKGRFDERRESADANYRSSLATTLAIALAAVLLAVGAAIVVSRAVVRQIGGLVAAIGRCEQGDFTVEAPVAGTDEIARSCERFNRLAARLREMIGVVRTDAVEISRAATALSSTSTQLSASSGHQSQAASAMAASVEQLTVAIDQVAQHSASALDVSRRSGDLSEEGNGVVSRAAAEMEHIGSAARELTAIIQGLGEQSGQISRIVSVIQEIANQTNLLALNAAIEAARAGEQGRGFSVVADEVRRLAERTTASTQEIGAMVSGIQEGTRRAVASMESWGGRVSEGVAQARGAGECMTRIRGGAGEVVSAVNEISSALKEQSAASTDMAKNVERIAQMSEENAAAVATMSDAAKRLELLAQQLAGAVAAFRTGAAAA